MVSAGLGVVAREAVADPRVVVVVESDAYLVNAAYRLFGAAGEL